MFKFLKSIFYSEKKDEENENLVKTSTSFKITDSIRESLNEAENIMLNLKNIIELYMKIKIN